MPETSTKRMTKTGEYTVTRDQNTILNSPLRCPDVKGRCQLINGRMPPIFCGRSSKCTSNLDSWNFGLTAPAGTPLDWVDQMGPPIAERCDYFAGFGVAGFRILCVNSFSSDQTQGSSSSSSRGLSFRIRCGATTGLI